MCVTNINVRRQYAVFINNGVDDPFVIKEIVKQVSAHAFTWNKALRGRKEFVMNHPKKIEIAELILASRLESKAITFNATIKQAEKFKTGFVVHSGKTKKKNKMTMEEFANVDKGCIHSSKSLNEGVDIPGLNLAIILHNTSSPTERIQKIGRTIRLGAGRAEIFSLVIKGTMEENWFKKSSVGLSHIEINEDELLDVLAGKEVNKKEIVQGKQQFLFTF